MDSVLGRFKREGTRQAYWNAVGAYANTFQAPVQYTSDYAVYRNSYPYIPGQHEGADLVYRFPDGAGDSVPFEVHAQANGVIVDAGPDGITRAYQLEKDYCGQTTVPGNQYVGRSGVFYWVTTIGSEKCGTGITGMKEIYFIALTGKEDGDDEVNDKDETPNNGVYPPSFGLLFNEFLALQGNGFVNVCTRNPVYGCVDGAGRQIIIWYDSVDDESGQPNRPEIQTVYYHVSVDELQQYQQLKTICSDNRNTTWTKTIIENDNAYNVCRILTGSFLGWARMIGFSTAPHLHYEVYVDRANDGGFDTPNRADDREDPLMAFATIR